MKYFEENPQLLQIGDFMIVEQSPSHALLKLTQGEYSEDTSYHQKVVDSQTFSTISEQAQSSLSRQKKSSTIKSISSKISHKYFKQYESRIVNDTFSYNQFASYLIHKQYLKEVQIK